MSFSIDIEAAKKTNLFKKFMQSKNKSTIVTDSKVESIVVRPNSPFLTPSVLHCDVNTEMIAKNMNSALLQKAEDEQLVETYNSIGLRDK
jgi:hypothetical protein